MTTEEGDSSNCIHPVIYDGMCTECGAFVSPDSRYNKMQDIYVLSSTIGTSKIEPFLLEHKKLALVVDLDKTLIDTTPIENAIEAEKIIAKDEEHKSDYFYFNVTPTEMYLVRLRPYVREFLNEIAPFYFMQVYTLAQRQYAMEVIGKIDPEGKFFNQRILTREDSSRQKKSISDFFLSGQHLAVVVDDLRDPWSIPNGSVFEGLVQVEGFKFFSNIDQPTQIKGPMPIEMKMEVINEHYLERMTEVMKEIHSKFYEIRPPSVADIITGIKKKVFENCYIYFCKIWGPEDFAQKELYIGNAEEFGGHVLNEFLPYTTHIVTTDPVHKDIIEAQKYRGIYIVNYKWFFNSVFRYQRQNEENPYYTVVNRQQISAPLITNGTEERTEPPKYEDIKDSDLDDFFKLGERPTTDVSTQSQTQSQTNSNTDSEEESHEYGSSCDSEDISFLYKNSEQSD